MGIRAHPKTDSRNGSKKLSPKDTLTVKFMKLKTDLKKSTVVEG